jgi:hypothetical protein
MRAVRDVLQSSILWLGLVCVAFGAAQLVLFDIGRALEWDEAVYLAEVHENVNPIQYDAHRSRGIILVVAPIALFGPPLWAVRLALALGSSVALFASLSIWHRFLGPAVPIAALLFASSWLTLFYGSEISPNLWSAFGSVAATGMMAAYFHDPARWRLLAFVILVGAVGVIRPVDATFIGGAVGLVVLGLRPVRWRLATSAAAGAIGLGWLPWVSEAIIMWGGVEERLSSAQEVFGPGVSGSIFIHHWSLTDGPLMGPDAVIDVPPMGLVWWVTLAILAVTAVVVSQSGTDRDVAILVLVTGAAVAAFYLLFPGALAPRFLLPAYALLSVGAAVGIGAAARRWHGEVPMARFAAIGVVVLVPWQVWNVHTATEIETSQVEARSESEVLGTILREKSGSGDPCYFASQYGWPQIQFYSGCRGTRYVRGVQPSFEGRESGYHFVLARVPPHESGLDMRLWHGYQIERPELSGWFMYRQRAERL